MKVIEEYGVKNVGNREVGIEIEMEGENLPIGRTDNDTVNWRGTEDGSLRGESAEYVLKKPVVRSKVAEVLNELQDYLRRNKSILAPSDRAGVHVHINVQQLTFKEVLRFITLYLIFEEPLVKFCGESREGNMFCLRACDAEALAGGLRRAVLEGSFSHMQRDIWRYAAINVTSLSKYGSLEFRAMRSVADFAIINTWVELLLRIKDVAAQFEDAKQIVESLSLRGAKSFSQQVFGSYAELIQCNNMEHIVLDSIRRVQEIAYTPLGKRKESLTWKSYVMPDMAIIDEVIIAAADRRPPGAAARPAPLPSRRRPRPADRQVVNEEPAAVRLARELNAVHQAERFAQVERENARAEAVRADVIWHAARLPEWEDL